MVLDEAQHIKNRQTQNAQAVKAVRAQHRLVLTGTPLENSVLDLWSIFDFPRCPATSARRRISASATSCPSREERRGAGTAGAATASVLVATFEERRGGGFAREAGASFVLRTHARSTQRLPAGHRGGRKEVLEAVGAQGIAKEVAWWC